MSEYRLNKLAKMWLGDNYTLTKKDDNHFVVEVNGNDAEIRIEIAFCGDHKVSVMSIKKKGARKDVLLCEDIGFAMYEAKRGTL